MSHNVKAHGKVTYVLGNLIKVEFVGAILQGEIAYVQLKNESLKAEVIEIDGKIAKLQVFEDTRGIKYGTAVLFTRELLEVELAPGLLSEIFDGLQNPLEKIADASGIYLERGTYIQPLDRVRKWEFHPLAKVGDILIRGDTLGTVPESHFTHQIMLPFSKYGEYTLTWIAPAGSYTIDTVIARVKNKDGIESELTMIQKWPVKIPLIQGMKTKPTEMMTTGFRILDTLNPLVKGGTTATPGPFGAGKTVLQQGVSKYSNVDIVIIAACGERAGEVVETLKTFPSLMDVHINKPLMDRTVIICNTSSMPVAAREASVYVGVTIAEYYRQMGLSVLLLADSTSRWAQAMREMSGRLEEIPGEEAFPAYLASRIAAFYERAGVLKLKNGKKGSVSIIGAVSPAGGNFQEPVTQATLSVVGNFSCLSRELSNRRIYPSIDPKESWSKYLRVIADEIGLELPEWYNWVENSIALVFEGNEIGRRMEVVGSEGTSMKDIVTYLKSELLSFAYLQQNAFDPEDAYCSMEQQKRQFALINKIFETDFVFANADEAKSYFLKLQTEVKGLNFIRFPSDRYEESFQNLQDKINAMKVGG